MLLTMEEKRKMEVIQAVMDDRLQIEEAGIVLDRSERQIYRMLKCLREEGLPGLIHGNKGKPSPRRIPREIRRQMVALARGRWKEILGQKEKIRIGRETLRTILRDERESLPSANAVGRSAGVAGREKRLWGGCSRSMAPQKVEVLQFRDGSIEIIYKEIIVARFSPETVGPLLKHNKHIRTELKAA